MRKRLWTVCAAVALAVTTAARAQPPADFAPAAGDPFRDPIFLPPGTPTPKTTPQPKPEPTEPPSMIFAASLFDAATAPDPLGPLPSAAGELARQTTACACAPGFTAWFSAELLIGSTRGPSLVPVVTTGPASAGPFAGAVGQPTTVALFGGRQILNDWRSGLRAAAGVWLDPAHRGGVGARVYSLFSGREHFATRATGASVVNVPHLVPVGGSAVQLPVFVGFPGLTAGGATASARTAFTGFDLNYRRLLDRGPGYRVELLAGYRQLYLGDELSASFTATPLGLPAALAPRLSGTDRVRTRNDFYGPQLGLYASTGWNRLTLEGHAATALGVTVSDLDFARARALGVGPAGNPAPVAAGLAALGVPGLPLGATARSDSLTYFGVVAEGGVRLKWSVTDHLRLTGGYSFLYWNDVRRAPEMFAGSPALRPRAVDFATHLFSTGLELRY